MNCPRQLAGRVIRYLRWYPSRACPDRWADSAHQRAVSDPALARRQAQSEPDGDPPLGGPTAGQGHSVYVEERDLPVSAPAQEWRPRATAPEELDDARTVLVVHRLDPRTGRCAACAADCPCPPALDAGRILAEAGAWNTVPFTSFTGPRAAPGRTRAQGGCGWVARLVRRLLWTAASR